ncbi:interleukin-21 receptor-like isoform X1 [Carcharodon carcharias]|uniref:interleukin-21 receptor-like isoform X1 n=1 Tax=Carcharodon carcharias TaxID=13397 RepID=UPI001B7DE688|nr:interleukin-21 receptor-like isoform X1 [Carcharodon carcharias]XP_041061824.1 interleukin-21 receptor-like isoform X1 [Carcharodon carcharias]XP_041061825.1 interleukin-21 receptor-like isoform X1 [Carcharodon carcharias]
MSCLWRILLPTVLLLLLCRRAQCTTGCDGLTCVTDYLQYITCIWRVTAPQEPGVSYHLTAASLYDEISCNLNVTSCSDADKGLTECKCELYEEIGITSENYTISIKVKNEGKAEYSEECPYFNTAQNVKPRAPFNLDVSYFAPCEAYNFTWQIAYGNYDYLEDFEYELRYKRIEDSWEHQIVKHIRNNQRTFPLVASELTSDTEHLAQIRSCPAEGSDYTGTWSDWSPTVNWRTAACKTDLEQIPWLPFLCGLIPTLILVVAVVIFNVPQRLRKKLWVMTPNPAPFFKPLFVDHGGNFTSWVNAQHPDALYEVNEKNVMVLEKGDSVQVYDEPVALQKTLMMGLKPWDKQSEIHSSWQALCGPSSCVSSHSRGQFGNNIQQWKDKSYGRVSINTVTVTDEVVPCCSQCSYKCKSTKPPYLTQCNSNSDADNSNEQDYPISNQLFSHLYPVTSETLQNCDSTTPFNAMSLLQSAGAQEGTSGNVLDLHCLNMADWGPENEHFPLNDGEDASWNGRNVGEGGSWSDGSLDTISSCSRLEPDLGYPKTLLDLDTVDSGFIETDTDSMTAVDSGYKTNTDTGGIIKVEQEQEPDDNSPANSEQEEQYYRSYVKQWARSTSNFMDCSSHG